MAWYNDLLSAVAPIGGTIAGSLVGGPVGAAIGGALGSGVSSSLEKSDSRNWQMDLLNTQHQWAVEDWERMNEYNMPKNQIKRLEEAGLNPLLADATGGLSSSPVTEPKPTESDLSAKASMMSAMRENQLLQSQLEVNAAEKEKLQSEASLNEQKATTEEKTRDWTIDLLRSQADVNDTTCSLNLAKTDVAYKSLDEIEAHIKEMSARANQLNENANLFNIQSQFYQKQINWFDTEMTYKLNRMAAEAGYFGAKATEAIANAQFLGEQLETQKEITKQAGIQSEDMRYELEFKTHPAVEKCRATLILLKQKKAEFSLNAPDWSFKVGGFLDACSGGAQLLNTALNDATIVGAASIPRTIVKAAPK